MTRELTISWGPGAACTPTVCYKMLKKKMHEIGGILAHPASHRLGFLLDARWAGLGGLSDREGSQAPRGFGSDPQRLFLCRLLCSRRSGSRSTLCHQWFSFRLWLLIRVLRAACWSFLSVFHMTLTKSLATPSPGTVIFPILHREKSRFSGVK